jgi:hypothetical protein
MAYDDSSREMEFMGSQQAILKRDLVLSPLHPVYV